MATDIQDALDLIAQLDKQGQPTSVQDYLGERKKSVEPLPSLSSIYRNFGSWHDFLLAAGISPPESKKDLLLGFLHACASDLGEVPSSHQYDRWRQDNKGNEAPSSSVIRKWLGTWSTAIATIKTAFEADETTRQPAVIGPRTRLSGLAERLAL